MKPCLFCGTDVPGGVLLDPDKVFCDPVCRARFRSTGKRQEAAVCSALLCFESFDPHEGYDGWLCAHPRKFCSKGCRNRTWEARRKAKKLSESEPADVGTE